MHPLPPPHEAAEPGWYVDPIASDMLRWWDGTGWSETEFKLARPLVKPEVRRDLLLGAFGRRGSIANVVFCAVLLLGLLVGALTVHPLLWMGVASCVLLEIMFIAMAIVVRRYGWAGRGQELIRRIERHVQVGPGRGAPRRSSEEV